MAWSTIRRMGWHDYERAIPRLAKFCKRHNIDCRAADLVLRGDDVALMREGLASDAGILFELMHEIRMWTEEPEYNYRVSKTVGQRAQMARRVWQRAVQESRADFGVVSGYIGYPVD